MYTYLPTLGHRQSCLGRNGKHLPFVMYYLLLKPFAIGFFPNLSTVTTPTKLRRCVMFGFHSLPFFVYLLQVFGLWLP